MLIAPPSSVKAFPRGQARLGRARGTMLSSFGQPPEQSRSDNRSMSTTPEQRVRALLVHANPFQRVMPVPPYGLERIRTAAAGTGAEIEIVDPYLVSDRPVEAAVEAARRLRP